MLRLLLLLILVTATGCSTAPLVGTLDWLRPSRPGTAKERTPTRDGPFIESPQPLRDDR
jgi:hypothetical protein